MSNINLIIEEKAADIGNFLVGRLLPFRQKRHIGPFVFIDHMGPEHLSSSQNLDIAPHPHIGLSTLTFLLEGKIRHRDSLGNDLVIEPGAVNWMTAGKGVVHSERTPDADRTHDKTLHGLQIWVALPKELEQMEPEFQHIEASEIPVWEQEGVQFKLIAGEVLGRKSPVKTFSPLYFVELKCSERKSLKLGENLYGEVGLYVLEGSVAIAGKEFGPKQLLIAKDAQLCEFEINENTIIFLFGGDEFPEERFMHWNFVSSDKQQIEQAKLDWYHQNLEAFPKVPGDEDAFIPLPESSLKVH